jgi:hypothetical protein
MGTGDLIFIAILVVLVASFWIRRRWRYVDDQRDDASLDRKRSEQIGDASGGGDGGGD